MGLTVVAAHVIAGFQKWGKAMTVLHEKAWTCIYRWERRGYQTQVDTFKAVMAENERLREVVYQYRDDLQYPPSADSIQRRLKMIDDVLEGK